MVRSRCGSVSFLAAALFLAGCSGNGTTTSSSGGKQAAHGHPDKGPHGGDLIELGDEKYHVEMIHDDEARKVTFYILDGTAKKTVAIDAPELNISLKHEGKMKPFKVPAVRDAGDPRFESKDEGLVAGLDHEDADPQLVVMIDNKQYTAEIKHEHGSEGHAGHKD